MWGLAGIHRPIACVAATWLLLSSFGRAHGHPTTLLQRRNTTSPTLAADASVSEGDQQQVVTPPSPEQESQHLEIGQTDGQPPEAAPGVPVNPMPPSRRCANREEWQGTCRLWSGKSHNRYLAFNRMPSIEGVGASLRRVSWALRRVISVDLQPVINGPLLAVHCVGDFGDWVGFTHNPFLLVQDPVAFQNAANQTGPFPEGNGNAWFLEQANRTSVVYTPDTMKVQTMKGWGRPVSPANSDPRVCRYVRQALRNIYWRVPNNRGRCHGLLPDDHHMPPEVTAVSEATGHEHEGKRPWVVAVHVRRGDTIHYNHGSRSLPQTYFSAAVKSILLGIAIVDPAALVSVLVFSEGPETLTGLQLLDEHGEAITWDVEQESCWDIGLTCSQIIFLKTSAFETFDCLAAADVVVGSRSTFSDSFAAVSTNVKVMLRKNQVEQDRVVLNPEAIASAGAVSLDDQFKMNTAIADWWYCSGEARRSTGSDAASLAARRFYQTVDEGLSPS